MQLSLTGMFIAKTLVLPSLESNKYSFPRSIMLPRVSFHTLVSSVSSKNLKERTTDICRSWICYQKKSNQLDLISPKFYGHFFVKPPPHTLHFVRLLMWTCTKASSPATQTLFCSTASIPILPSLFVSNPVFSITTRTDG
jgi:hypothetical protein